MARRSRAHRYTRTQNNYATTKFYETASSRGGDTSHIARTSSQAACVVNKTGEDIYFDEKDCLCRIRHYSGKPMPPSLAKMRGRFIKSRFAGAMHFASKGSDPFWPRSSTRPTGSSDTLRMRFSLSNTRATDRSHPRTIKLRLRDISQLFNSMDPSPFIEKDLDDDAEEFIVSWAQEFSPKALIGLRIYLDQWPPEDPKELIRAAVHNHFAHRAEITNLEFKRLLAQGRTSLLIGLLFLVGCLLLSEILLGRTASAWAAVARESLTIAGWVAMWRPMQIYLYDWWPLLRRRRIYAKLAQMPVELVQKTKA